MQKADFRFPIDVTTISITPFLKKKESGENIPVAISVIVDCQGHLANGGKKNGTLLCNRFL